MLLFVINIAGTKGGKMKIISIGQNNYGKQNFGVKLTKDVQRGFDNLGYKIKKDFGSNSDEYVKYKNYRQKLNKNCKDMTLDYIFNPMLNSNDKLGLLPYTFTLSSNNIGNQALYGIIREKYEEDLYSINNLKFLANCVEKLL